MGGAFNNTKIPWHFDSKRKWSLIQRPSSHKREKIQKRDQGMGGGIGKSNVVQPSLARYSTIP